MYVIRKEKAKRRESEKHFTSDHFLWVKDKSAREAEATYGLLECIRSSFFTYERKTRPLATHVRVTEHDVYIEGGREKKERRGEKRRRKCS